MGAGQSVKISIFTSNLQNTQACRPIVDTATNQVTEKSNFIRLMKNLNSYTSQKAEGSLDWRINNVLGCISNGLLFLYQK